MSIKMCGFIRFERKRAKRLTRQHPVIINITIHSNIINDQPYKAHLVDIQPFVRQKFAEGFIDGRPIHTYDPAD